MADAERAPVPQQAAQPQRPPPNGSQPNGSSATGSRSAVSQYEAVLQQKERLIRESIARKIGRIHEVERQLADLSLSLHVNVEPRKQALEHIRHKIEEQNREIDKHRTAHQRAKAAMEAAAAALAAAEARKAQLSEELTLLVTQSAGAQLKKLEDLQAELEQLTGEGLPQASGAASYTHGASSPPAAASDATVHVQQVGAAAAGQQQQQQPGEGPDAGAGTSVGMQHDQPGAADEQQQQQQHEQQQERQRQAAEAARARHVQLGGRRPGGRPPPSQASSSQPTARGPFQGFD